MKGSHRSYHRKSVLGCILLVVYGMAAMPDSRAQSIHPDILLRQPHRTTANQIQRLREQPSPKIGLLLSEQTITLNPAYEETLRAAVRQWEQFLLGHELPYRVLGDTSLSQNLPASMRLLILPSVEVLSGVQKDVLRQYMRRGGGVIASGRLGYFDEWGVLQNDQFFREIFDAEPTIDLPDTLPGLIQSLDGGHILTEGLPAGFKLNVSRPDFAFAALPTSSTSLGTASAYEPLDIALVDEAIEISTLLFYGAYEGGRFVWLGFNPQDVSLESRQQAAYQALILNSLAYASNIPMASFRRWPFGNVSASAFAMLPALDYRPYAFRSSLDLIVQALDRAGAPATGFFVADQVVDQPDLMERFASLGELALIADTPTLLDGQPYPLQLERLQAAARVLQNIQSTGPAGLYPPGGFYDDNTLRAALNTGVNYMLLDDRSLMSPSLVAWEDELDYRDTLLAQVRHDPFASAYSFAPGVSTFDRSPQDLVAMYPSLFSFELLEERARASSGAWRDRLLQAFHRTHQAEGLFLFALDIESMGQSTQRVYALEQAARAIGEQKSWLTTLGEIQRWWHAREDLSISFAPPSQDAYEIVVENKGDRVLAGVSLNFWYNTSQHGELLLETPDLNVNSTTMRDKIVLVIQSLPPGSHTIRLVASGQDALTAQ